MTNEDFNTKLNSSFTSIRENILDVLSQLYKQEFAIDQNIVGSGDPKSDIQNDVFPKVLIRFTTDTSDSILHVWTLPLDLASRLYGWMIDEEADESVTDEHLAGLKEGAEQIIGQIRAWFDGEGKTLKVTDLEISIADTYESLDLSDAADEGSAATYTIAVNDSSFSVNHYLFTNYSGTEDSVGDPSMSDADIEKMLNDEELDPRANIDADLADDVDIKEVEFGSFGENEGMGSNGQPRNIDMLLDVDLEVLVELGRKTMLIKDVLKLGKGSVVELDKAAGEPLGIFVNGRKLAEGEVVVIDDHFGIRITQLAGQAERIQSLG